LNVRLLVVFLIAGCNTGLPQPGADLASADLTSSSSSDLSSSDLSSTGDAAGQCDLSKTTVRPGGAPIGEGTFCDDVYFCVAHGGVAQAIVGMFPDFTCQPGTSPNMGGCSGLQWFCEWTAGSTGTEPGVLDAAEIAQLCQVLAYPTPPALITCMVYI
jgi:hypothetical protein